MSSSGSEGFHRASLPSAGGFRSISTSASRDTEAEEEAFEGVERDALGFGRLHVPVTMRST